MKAIIKPIKIDSILEYKNFKTLDEKDLYIVTTIFTGFLPLYQVPTVLTTDYDQLLFQQYRFVDDKCQRF